MCAGEVEVLGVLADILLEPGMACVFGEVIQEGEVGITHHLFAGAGEESVVGAGSAFLCLLLEQGQHGCVPLGVMTPAPTPLDTITTISSLPPCPWQAGAREHQQSHQVP